MSSNELQALFSSLRPRSRDQNAGSPNAASFSQPSSQPSSSAFFHTAQVPSTPPPPFSATGDDNMVHSSENSNQLRSTSAATAQTLLNLLNFGGPQNASTTPFQPSSASNKPNQQATVHRAANTSISASDLVARFMSPTLTTPKLEQKEEHTETAQLIHTEASANSNPLLELLSKQSARAAAGSKNVGDKEEEVINAETPIPSIEDSADMTGPVSSQVRNESPLRVFGTAASREHTPFEAPKSASPMPSEAKPIFTYTNPFEALNASRQETPARKSPAPARVSTPAHYDVQLTAAVSSPSVISARKKLTPKLRSQRSTTSQLRESSPPDNQAELRGSEPTPPLEVEDMQPSIEIPAVTERDEIDQERVTAEEANKDEEIKQAEIVEDRQDDSGEWEDDNGSTGKDDTPRSVPVYNFPIKAFVSITLQLKASSNVRIRDDGVMEISRLKKEFDQLDRSLAAATSKYITYAFVKNGGMRIIRQDDGGDRHVFKHSHDRIFNVAFCTTASPSENQAVLGTGVSGAVYYASVSKEGNDLFEKNQLDSESLIFPPYPQVDEHTAGGVLKTRAKRSSRHPEYFAIGRGKSIQLVWPATALSPRYGITDTNRVVDVEKFYTDRPLQISTGKAGKDFTFSEDDTLMVSLDKTGRLRFWDIRSLVDESNATAARVTPVIVDSPVLSLSTASPAEKSWPTSVTFVDKARPYKKGGPLRYVLVGLRQNHTLQLWDIALGKAVQELNFPHENETDGICSVNYHSESGIIVVSHPTRNSIFFIHLSAPRYTLSSSLSQAIYVSRIAAKDPELPKPESTACMSGIREISFADKGQLRSVELLPTQRATDSPKDDSTSLFELYVVHSKGVTCLGINRQDLGWNVENKVLHPVDAQQEGLVLLKELKLGSIIEEPIRSKSPPKEAPQPSKSAKKKAKKAGQISEEPAIAMEDVQEAPAPQAIPSPAAPTDPAQPEPPVQDVAVTKEVKKTKKKAEKVIQPPEQTLPQPDQVRALSPVEKAPPQTNGYFQAVASSIPKADKPETPILGITEENLRKELTRIEQSISAEFKKELGSLHENIQGDRAAQESSSASRQEAILRLVSSSLSTNVEKSLSRILAQQLQQTVVPVLVQHASTQVADTLSSILNLTLPQEIGKHVPAAVSTTLQSPHMSRTITDAVTQKLTKHLETQVTDMVVKTVTPVFQSIATAAAEKATTDTEARLIGQMRQLQLDRTADNEKIDRLSGVLEGMANTLQAMSDSQVAFQGQILRDRQALALASTSGTSGIITTSRQVSTARGTPDPASLVKPKPMRIRSKADIELEEITNLMNEGRYEDGSIKWLQSTQPVKLFDELFVRFTPEYLATDVSPLVAFSVAVTVANSLSTNTERRLEWISAAFDAVDLQDPEIADLSQHAPALVTSLVQKLESLYMTIAERNPSDSILRVIPTLAKKGRDMKTVFMARAGGSLASSFPHMSSAGF